MPIPTKFPISLPLAMIGLHRDTISAKDLNPALSWGGKNNRI